MDASLNGPLGPISLTTTILTLGRMQDNQVVVNDPKASSRHAEIRPTVYGYSIVDLGSTNGTFVNEQRLEAHNPRPLNSTDTIRIGDTRFTYTASGSSEVPPTVYASPGLNSGGDLYPPTVAAPPAYNNYTPSSAPPPFPSPNYSGYIPPQQPGYVPPVAPAFASPQQPKRNLKWLWITLGIVGGLLVVLCAICGFLVFVANPSTPDKTLDTFCNDLNNKQYHDAYLQLSPRVQSTGSESSFTSTFTNVNSCAHTNAADNGTTGSANLTLTTRTGLAANFVVKLTKDSSNIWKIDDLQKPSA